MRHPGWLIGGIALAIGLALGEETERRWLRPLILGRRMNDPEFVRRSNRAHFISLAVVSAMCISVGVLGAL